MNVLARLSPWSPWVRATILFLTLVKIALVGYLLHSSAVATQLATNRASVSKSLSTLSAQIEGNLLAKSHLLQGLSAAVQLNDTMTQEQFQLIASTLLGNNSDILNIAAAPGLVVRYVYPFAPNQAAMGVDYRESAQFGAIRQAIATRSPILAGPLNLWQGGRGYILRIPIFKAPSPGALQDFWGIVSLVIDYTQFNTNVGLSDPELALDIALRTHSSSSTPNEVFFGDPDVFAASPVTQVINLPFGTWELAATPRGGWQTIAVVATPHLLIFSALSVLVLLLVNFIMTLVAKRQRAEERLANAIDAIDDGFALYDRNDRFVSCNRKYREFYSLSADLFVPGNSFEYIIREGVKRGQYPDAAGNEDAWIAERLNRHKQTDNIIVQQLAGGRWLKIAERRTSDGGTVGFRVDITELTEARDFAERASRAKTDFINVLSHELRTPMTVVLGYTSILANPQLFRAAREFETVLKAPEPEPELLRSKGGALLMEMSSFARKIESSGNQLLSLINELLDFSKIESGKFDIEATAFDLSEIATHVAEQFGFMAQRKKVSIRCAVPHLMVMADMKRTQQILVNLVSNAVKFTDAGHIEISAKQQGKDIVITVEDTGCGIPEDMRTKVFDEFQQADSSSTRKAGGTGLGLAIVKRIVEGHGGKVSLSSIPDLGTRVTFTLPAADASSSLAEHSRQSA